ncbi:hypothetical protein LDENG_00138240 [Lucifuga dentata]|nr:hypothetical protein LDENG_00138240 [Lucifuga dentata]
MLSTRSSSAGLGPLTAPLLLTLAWTPYWSSRDRTTELLYLQYGKETKQVQMPANISSWDVLWALFVTAFPQQLTMMMLQSPNMAVCIKDTRCNIYYNLEDVRNITSHSCLKLYHKDPKQVFSQHTRTTASEGRRRPSRCTHTHHYEVLPEF